MRRMAWATVRQGPFKAFACDVDSQNTVLTRVFEPPTRAVHHPQKRRLNPGHAIHLEWRRNKGAVGKCAIGDNVRVSLINPDGGCVIHSANLPHRWRGCGGCLCHSFPLAAVALLSTLALEGVAGLSS